MGFNHNNVFEQAITNFAVQFYAVVYLNILGNTSPKKECFLSDIARIRGGGGPCPNLLALFSQSNRP